MIEVLHAVTDGDDCLVRLGCTCGDPVLALYNCEGDQIIFCNHCGEMTTRNRLLGEPTLPSHDGQLIWLNVANHAECPLVNVSIPVTVSFLHQNGSTHRMALPAIVTKISTEKCFLRFERTALPPEQHHPQELLLQAEAIPLAGETPGWLEEAVRPFGPEGPTYYKIRLSLESPQRKADLESFFQSTCGLRFDWRVLLLADLNEARHLWSHLRECLPMAHIEVAASPAEFIRLYTEQKPELCLLPPEPELLQLVHDGNADSSQPGQRIVVLLPERTAETIGQALRWGADDILLQGCSRQDVQRAIQRCQKRDRETQDSTITLGNRWMSDCRAPIVCDSQPLAGGMAPTAGGTTTISVTEDDSVRLICMSSETHDPNSSNHLARMSAYSAAIARALDWPTARVARLATASKLHDVGKLGVPDEILHKAGALTQDERQVMQHHTRLGYQILQGSTSELIRLGAIIALRHHERWDGKGYPDNLGGDVIPLEAQIVTIADVFDALTTARVYKPAWTNDKARDFLHEQSGKMFAPRLVDAFNRVFTEIERNQLRFLDDFRDIWTERRQFSRHPAPPVPINLEIALPEQTFHPYRLCGTIVNLSCGGMKVMLNNVNHDLFSLLISSRRYARAYCPDPVWNALDQVACGVVWIDYYAVPDPDACLMGLTFQKLTPNMELAIESLSLRP